MMLNVFVVRTSSQRSISQRGRTLIELLVSIALSLLILLGVGTLYLGSSQTSRVSSGSATVEENGQILLSLIGRAIRRAGYSEIIGTQAVLGARDNFLYSGPHIRGCTGGRFNNPAADDYSCIADAARVGDTVAVWFQADSRLASPQSDTTDCLGAAAPLVNVASSQFAGVVAQIPLVRNIYFLDDAGNFQCLGNGGGGAQTLSNNVLDFRVYYGFDDVSYASPTGVTERPNAGSIRTAAEVSSLPNVGSLSPWEFVVSTHVCLLLRTQEGGLSAADGTVVAREFRPCPADTAEAASGAPLAAQPADGALRRAYVQVFTVRSRSTPNAAAP